jgi:diguanylate cyclase (GGDEF)-like protein
MDEGERALVGAFLEYRRIKKGDPVFMEGERGEELFLHLAGELGAFVGQSDGSQRLLFSISAGDFFGEMSVIAHEPRSATIIAKEDADLMVLRSGDFYRILSEHPLIGVKMLKTIGKVQNGWLDSSAKHLSDLMRWGETARLRAITDELTGLYNRRFLEDSLRDRFKQGAVGTRPVSFLMMDLDKVHEINERHGPGGGDTVIMVIADILREQVRVNDIAARLSGDEFAVLFPDANLPGTKYLAERIRTAVNARSVLVPAAPGAEELTAISVRTSIGIAIAPADADSAEALMEAADKALRKAKDLGRNRVEMASEYAIG